MLGNICVVIRVGKNSYKNKVAKLSEESKLICIKCKCTGGSEVLV